MSDRLPDATEEELADLRKTPRARRPRARLALSHLAWLADKVVQCEEAIDRLATPDDNGRISGQALASMLRQVRDLRRELETELASELERGGDASPETVRQVVEGWPDAVLEVVLRVYADRYDGRLLLVGEGGRRAELGESGWEPLDRERGG